MRRKALQPSAAWLLVPPVLLVAAAFLYPVGLFLLKAFSDPVWGLHNLRDVATDDLYLRIIWNTVVISASTTAFCLLLGYPVAYAMVQAKPRLRRILVFVVLIPFWTSILVRSFAWMVLLQPRGLLNAALLELGLVAQPVELIFNRLGLLIGMVQIQLPFMILPLFSVMLRIDPVLADAAANLGAPPARAFREVYLPLSLPGVYAGCLLVFVTSLGYYITPVLLGGRRDVMVAQVIQEQVADLGEWGIPAALSLVLLAGSFLLIALGRITQASAGGAR